MKFGKTYMETMADPSFPEEWRNGALEYKHLKKLINGVVAELESLGLGADVLRELLVRPEDQVTGISPTDVQTPALEVDADDEADEHAYIVGDMEASEIDSDQELDLPQGTKNTATLTPAGQWLSDFTVDRIKLASSALDADDTLSDTDPDLAYLDANTNGLQKGQSSFLQVPRLAKPRSRSHGVETLESRMDDMQVGSQMRGRPSFAAGSMPSSTKWAGIGRKDLEALRGGRSSSEQFGTTRKSRSEDPSPGRHDWRASKWREEAKLEWESSSKAKATLKPPVRPAEAKPAAVPARSRWVEGKSGRRARAEYELGGTPEHPVPRIRLFIESPIQSDDEGDAAVDDGDTITDDNSSTKSLEEKIIELPITPPRRFSSIPEDGPEGETREEKVKRQGEIRKKRGVRPREIVIPLTADTQFLDTLTHALQNLSGIQNQQRDNFVAETESLCSTIARASSPFASKNDLYVWREIFSLWMEMQVFESQREKDRGELSIDESETRLKRFALELAKRGWIHDPNATASTSNGRSKKGRLVKLKLGSGPSSQGLHNKDSATAVEDFLRLNFALLDVKKFQRVNVEAARKILKKHDKRTALTASDDLRTFMAQQEAERRAMGINPVGTGKAINIPISAFGPNSSSTAGPGTLVSSAAHPSLAALLPSSATGILSESLPHILLSLVTTTLLPILPSVDDYSCAICTSVAWRPVRLDCSHLFCLRCLVKLQKQGKADCPLCRATDAVKTADHHNMNEETDKYLQTWFPREVKEKTKENLKDRRQEELQAMGLREEKCFIQ